MTRNVTIHEGTAEADNHIEIRLIYLGEWTVEFMDQVDWNQGDLTDWLVDRLDAPMTVADAIADDRTYVQNRDHEIRDTEIGGFDADEIARATYDPDEVEWTVELLN